MINEFKKIKIKDIQEDLTPSHKVTIDENGLLKKSPDVSGDITGKEDKANKGITDGYAPLNASVKIAATYLEIVNDLVSGGVDKLLSAEQGKVLKGQIDAINTLLTSDNINLDTIQEIVDAIETVQTSLSTILVNDLTTGGTTKALTAQMGVTLKGLIDALTTVVNGKAPLRPTTTKTTLVDADEVTGNDSANTFSQIKTTWTNVKVFLKTYFDTIYQAVLISGTNIKTINGGSILGSGDIIIGTSVLEIVSVPATTYIFLLTDVQKKVIFTSATAVTVTIPTNASTAIPIGSKIEITQSGVGIVTLVTTGLTIISATLSPITLVQGQTVYLVKTAINSWTIGLNMGLSGAQTVSGLKTFLQDTLGLRNTANTFNSFFRNANTASRYYTLPNKDMTVAGMDDVNTKLTTPVGGIANYLSKFLTATTIGISRLWDTGTFFGIGTVNTPTKDITLGNQANREIGIEESSSYDNGKNLIITAGRTINYAPSNFIVSQQPYQPKVMCVDPNGDVYIIQHNSEFYVKYAGTSVFVRVINNAPIYLNSLGNCVTMDIYGDMYVSDGNIYKRTNRTGAFVGLGLTGFNRIASSRVTDALYATKNGVGIYKYNRSTLVWDLQSIVVNNYGGLAVANNGNVYTSIGSQLYKQINGIGSFVTSSSLPISPNSITCLPNGIIYIVAGKSVYKGEVDGVFTLVQNDFTYTYCMVESTPDGNVYAVSNDNYQTGILYILQLNTVGLPNLNGGALQHKAGTGKGTGKSRIEFITGAKTASGTDMQIETLREYIDENGYHVYTSMPVYADNASALAGGLVIGTKYRTAPGDLKIVY